MLLNKLVMVEYEKDRLLYEEYNTIIIYDNSPQKLK